MQTYFNLDTGEIKGKIKFLNGSDGFTSIDGGLLMSEVIEVGDDGNVNAFVSGKTDVGDTTGISVRFGAGSDYDGRNTAPFRVQHNGKMIAENADIQGTINAEAGYIGGVGGWKITSTMLTSTTGKLLFGDFDSSGNFISGVSISADNYPGNPNFRNRFKLSSIINGGGTNNYTADISASGSGNNNVAMRLSASGGIANVGLEIDSPDVAININSGKIRMWGNETFTGEKIVKDGNGVNQILFFQNGILLA
jgi:hypothetical protein